MALEIWTCACWKKPCVKKAKAAFSVGEGEKSKKFEHCGWRGLENVRTGGRLPIWGGGGPHYLITCNVIFIYLMTLFMVQNLKIIFTADKELWQCASFGPNMDHLPQTNIFWKIIIILVYLLALSIVQNLEKLLPVDPELWGSAILQPKMTHFPKWKFFFLLIFSEILMIKEYWNLIGRELFLSITWELHFSEACSFPRILMSHKNFHLTQIPDKHNGVIFLKSAETMFLDHFWPFLSYEDSFQKNPAVIYNYIWAPNIMLSFKKK